ncbi:MAG: hypothetical protein EOQ28_32945 [Mesorhizobium sp.]|uniref:hypothetical protein n=1 Tax=Mesorhizobium sp. TaxID=1871066 RepID=UPI000FE7CB64|nr:hypothetical protein [Mesorhizobium sp.]RWA59546.1 MAG: hypothetical protein EOQ28_32945 [Mesorhizobium sp.]RWB93490.1 MAG: hypothetical protein EOQ57_34100 [Mesorhizobium sp.]
MRKNQALQHALRPRARAALLRPPFEHARPATNWAPLRILETVARRVDFHDFLNSWRADMPRASARPATVEKDYRASFHLRPPCFSTGKKNS